ncbi:MAG: DUF3870 domain-containing protein [Brotaphodocola sp.]
MYNNTDYFLVAGGAQTPRNTNLNDVYQIVSVQLLVHKETKIVEDANVNVISPLTAEFFRDAVVGYCMDDPIDPLLDYLKENLLTPATSSTIQALRAAVLRYRESKWYKRK